MNKFLKELTSSKTSLVVSNHRYAIAVKALKGMKVEYSERRWVKSKGFRLITVPEFDMADAVVIPKKGC